MIFIRASLTFGTNSDGKKATIPSTGYAINLTTSRNTPSTCKNTSIILFTSSKSSDYS